MGEVTTTILCGEACQYCGVYMEDAQGYPRSCSDCSEPSKGTLTIRVPCPTCGKMVKKVGLQQHIKDVHGEDNG